MFLRNVDKHLPDYTTSYIYTFIFAAMKTSTSHGTNNSIQCVERFLGRQSPKAELDQEMVSDIYIYIYIGDAGIEHRPKSGYNGGSFPSCLIAH